MLKRRKNHGEMVDVPLLAAGTILIAFGIAINMSDSKPNIVSE